MAASKCGVGSDLSKEAKVIIASQGTLRLGDILPDVNTKTSTSPDKEMSLHEYFGDSWGILFSHPADFTPVCTTELGMAAKYEPEFTKRNVKLAAISCNNTESHVEWIKDIKAATNQDVMFPILADADRKIAIRLGMLNQDHCDAAKMPMTVRKVFIVNPARKIMLDLTYPASTGRNFDEIIRCIDSLQLTAKEKLATPANWKTGDKCVIIPSVKDEEAKKKFDAFEKAVLPSGKSYLRYARTKTS